MRPLNCFAPEGTKDTVPVTILTSSQLETWLEGQSSQVARFVRAAGFTAEAGRVLLYPTDEGGQAFVAGRTKKNDGLWAGALASALPEGPAYRLEGLSEAALERAALGWALGAYQFTSFKKPKRGPAQLFLPKGRPAAKTLAAAEASYFVRDLVNTPAEHMGPDEIEQAARELSERHGAEILVTKGDALLGQGLNLIHAVGRAADRAPRLIDITWGDAGHPKVTLVGKGVVFDTGGLDIKPASGMLIMKKDMGGAAHVLGLAHMIMSAGLPVRLRVLVPVAENAISGNAFRPGDIIKSHKGLMVEIGNTDAEGRLILADALSVADAEEPDVIVDMATLTGAARSALGPELPAMFSTDDDFANALVAAGQAEADPLWRMPLWAPYGKWLDSPVADISNTGSSNFAGAITAALFLERFVEKANLWTHLDIYAWSPRGGGARSLGGEAQTLRALFRVLSDRYAGKGKE